MPTINAEIITMQN